MIAEAHVAETDGQIRVDKYDQIATVTIDHESRRNAITSTMYTQLAHVLEILDQDPAVVVIVLRGAGQEAFAAGRDVRELVEVSDVREANFEDQLLVTRAERTLEALTKPTLAMIHGYCLGGGLGLAVCCDLRLADERASFSVPPANLGLVYGYDSTKRLVDHVGPSSAKYLMMTGLRIDAERAQAMQLVDEVTSVDVLEATVYTLAQRIASRAQLSVRAAKEFVRRVKAGQVHDDTATVNLRNAAFMSHDYREGIHAFIERRDPDFR